MAFDITRIEAGPLNLWVGTTLPTSGAPPTLITHTAGVPGSGTAIGLTEGDSVLEIKSEKKEIQAEQFYAPVEVFLTNQGAKMMFTAKEMTVIALKQALDGIGQTTTATEDLFYFGAGSGSFSIYKPSLFFSSRRRDNPAKYIIGMLYSVYSSKPLTLAFSRTKEATYAVELTALAVTTRTAGDCIGQFYREIG